MNDEIYSKIADSLSIIANIQASKYILDNFADKSNREKITVLSLFGFNVEAIARIVGTTPGTVKKELSVMKSTSKGEQ